MSKTNNKRAFLKQAHLANGSAYENTHPVAYTAIKIISNDIKTGAERDRASYDLDSFETLCLDNRRFRYSLFAKRNIR